MMKRFSGILLLSITALVAVTVAGARGSRTSHLREEGNHSALVDDEMFHSSSRRTLNGSKSGKGKCKESLGDVPVGPNGKLNACTNGCWEDIRFIDIEMGEICDPFKEEPISWSQTGECCANLVKCMN